MEKVRILLADDHALFRKGLAGLLAAEPDFEVVGEARTGKEALELARDLMPDLVLMDIFMPEGDGLQATRRLKEELPYVRVVILTISEKEETLFEAIKAGAQGYLLKGIEPPELLEMLRGLGRGEAAISRSMAAKILKEFSRREPPARPEDSPLTRLTAREFRVSVPDFGYWRRQIKCQDACPVHTDARGCVTAIADANPELAYIIARELNPFASICGCVCAAPCEAAS